MFQTKPTAKITAKYADSKEKITIDGVNSQEDDENNAAAQINKILNFVGKTVVSDGMTMTIQKEVGDNG